MLSRLFSKRTARSFGAPIPRGLVLDAETLELVAELPAGGWRGDIEAGPDGVWFSTYDDRSVSHVGPDGDVRVRVELDARPVQIALDGARPLVLCERGDLLRVDPEEGRVTDGVRLPGATAVAAVDGHVWILVAGEMDAAGTELTLARLDPLTLAVVQEIALRRSRYYGDIQVHEGTVNALHESSPGSMGYATFDAATGAPRPTAAELTRVRGIAERDGVRWTRRDDAEVLRVDLATGQELASHRLEVPKAGGFLLAHGRIWALAWRPPSQYDSSSS